MTGCFGRKEGRVSEQSGGLRLGQAEGRAGCPPLAKERREMVGIVWELWDVDLELGKEDVDREGA
jgi:hypothetical protein